MRPIKMSISVSLVFAFPAEEHAAKKVPAIRMYPGCYGGNEPCSRAMVHIGKPDRAAPASKLRARGLSRVLAISRPIESVLATKIYQFVKSDILAFFLIRSTVSVSLILQSHLRRNHERESFRRETTITHSCVLGVDDNSCSDGCTRGREGDTNRLRKTTVAVPWHDRGVDKWHRGSTWYEQFRRTGVDRPTTGALP